MRRTFQLLPVLQKTSFLDTILDSSTGLMPSGKVTKGYGKRIVDFLLEGRDQDMPFEVKELLGSASVKYTMRGIDKKTGKEIALKIFRNTAFTKAKQQFRVLEGMASYMISNFGREYAIVKTIVNASIEAVKKELDAKAEVQKSDTARLSIYKTKSMEIRPCQCLVMSGFTIA